MEVGTKGVLWGLVVALGTGCGIIDSNIADVRIALPEKTVTIDTAQWGVTSTGTFPSIDCSMTPGICATGAMAVCGSEDICLGSCQADRCMATIAVSLFNRMELDSEVPALSALDSTPLGRVSVDSILFTVPENTLNVATPPLTVYVGAQDVMAPGHAEAQEIGVIPALAPGETADRMEIEVSAMGQAALQARLKAYTSPFNVIVGGTIELRAGDPVPNGLVRAIVNVEATAGL